MPQITPFLWFNGQAEDAARFYTSIFKNSKMGQVARFGENAPGPKGSVMVANFELDGQHFTALNGGPQYTITPAISFVVHCADQADIDYYWEKLSVGGKEIQCGWLTDRFGVSWQIVPTILWDLLRDPDAAKTDRVMQALWRMVKLNIEELKQAYEGR